MLQTFARQAAGLAGVSFHTSAVAAMPRRIGADVAAAAADPPAPDASPDAAPASTSGKEAWTNPLLSEWQVPAEELQHWRVCDVLKPEKNANLAPVRAFKYEHPFGEDIGNGRDMREMVEAAIENVRPLLEVRSLRLGGRTQQVPGVLKEHKQYGLATKWLVEGARLRKKKSKNSFEECMAAEIIDAVNGSGHARSKRVETHKVAEANRALMRYRWW